MDKEDKVNKKTTLSEDDIEVENYEIKNETPMDAQDYEADQQN